MAAFSILEATIDDLHGAYRSGSVTCREVVQAYHDRIEKIRQARARNQRVDHGQL
jgi:Asp-tRNA(Asn)/Glu-tRNA(Gln) amidotransferase A subunit family amidase